MDIIDGKAQTAAEGVADAASATADEIKDTVEAAAKEEAAKAAENAAEAAEAAADAAKEEAAMAVENAAEAAEAAKAAEAVKQAQPAESMADYEKEIEASMKRVKEGDIVKGIIVGVDEQEVLVDMGYFTGAVISKENFSNDPDCILKEAAVIGSEITATVIETSDNEGRVVLSRKEANDIEMWDKLNEYLVNRTIIPVKVSGVVKGGVIAMVEGMRGFIPASKLSTSYVEDIEEYLGRDLEVQVITADKEENKLVLSAKEVLLMKAADEKNKRIARCEVGSVVEGVVDSIKKYGAFIMLDNGLSGLLHISQISDKRIKTPAAVLNEGDRVTVKIISIDNNKLSLSMKALMDVADTKAETEEEEAPVEYTEEATASTSLGSLLAGFKFD
ncbi:MAG: S1 RNA-binding domain-containing protein [Lachnospiraceae bacterium]|nr:S1 RNA-binding domain-containing protein [Lachnospiraceae bacterium]